MMATSCMLPNPMACCTSCDVRQAADTLRDVIPLTDALRDVITLSSHCHNLMPPPPATSCAPPPPTPHSLMGGVSQPNDRSTHQDLSPPPPSSSRRPPSPPLRVPRHAAASSSSSVRSIGASDPPGVVVVPKTIEGVGEQLPVLEVVSKFLRYRGEGAEHIVLRVLTSGQVLRLRKTPVGAVTSTADLALRAKKDEEFLCNVARPILGPLLTDESRLVRLESDTVRELKDTLGPEREVNRRHKEINSEGVACICPDAASIFILRSTPTLSSSPTSSTPSSSSFHEFSVSSSSACEQNLNGVDDVERCNGQDFQKVSNRALFPDSRKISRESKSEQNLRTTQRQQPSISSDLLNASSLSLLSSSSASSSSVESRCSSQRSSNTNSNGLPPSPPPGVPESLGWSSHIPTGLHSSEPRNICVEIKPKQGFIDTSTPELPLCRYCVKQYIKVGKDADQTTSRYCPLDLFSGNLTRMRKAVEGLLESPQNNLKVFVDGESVDNCVSFRYLRDVIIAALTYDFTTAKAELPGDGYLSPWSPLGRTLAFQTLDKLGVFNAVSLYGHLVKVIGQAKAADALLQDLKCWTGDSQFCQSNNELCTRCTQDDRQQINDFVVDQSGRKKGDASLEAKKHLTENENNPTPGMNIPLEGSTTYRQRNVVADRKPRDLLEPIELKGDDGNCRILGKSPSSFMQEDIIRKLQEYLLSTTAKDLSLMILLSGPHRSAPVPSSAVNASPFIIELEPGMWFRCQVTGVDLVAKPPSKILKHEQDYMRLKAVLEELKRQGKEPSCCRQ